MADGSIQVNEQTAYGAGYQRRCKCRCQRSCHDERAGIVAAVGVQQRLTAAKQLAIRRGNPVATVFAGDHEAIASQAATSAARASIIAAVSDSMFSGLTSPGWAVG